MKTVNIILAILFAIFTGVQYNDPDSFAWIILYVFITFLFIRAAGNKFYSSLIWVGIGACVWGALISAGGAIQFLTNDDGITFSQGMSNTFPYIEIAREFGGLLIALAALVFLRKQADTFNQT